MSIDEIIKLSDPEEFLTNKERMTAMRKVWELARSIKYEAAKTEQPVDWGLDPLIDDMAFKEALPYGPDDECNAYHLDEGNLRHFLARYLKTARPMRESGEVIKHDAVPLGQIWVHNPDKPKPLPREELLENYSEQYLHDNGMHPDYEYETTVTARKSGDSVMPEGEGWEPNNRVRWTSQGKEHECNWERGDYTEEEYWKRRKLNIIKDSK